MTAFLLIVLPLVAGLSLYLLFDGCAVWPWLDPWVQGLALCNNFPRINELTSSDLRWLRFYVPDVLWAFSFAACFVFVGRSEQPRRHNPWLMYGVVVLPELGQFAGVLPGTADPFDLVLILLGCWLGQHCMERKIR